MIIVLKDFAVDSAEIAGTRRWVWQTDYYIEVFFRRGGQTLSKYYKNKEEWSSDYKFLVDWWKSSPSEQQEHLKRKS